MIWPEAPTKKKQKKNESKNEQKKNKKKTVRKLFWPAASLFIGGFAAPIDFDWLPIGGAAP